MTNETTAEHVLTITNGVSGSNSDLWIADSGAMSHMTNSLERMYDITDVSTHVKVGDGKHINMVKSGKICSVIQQQDGSQTEIVLTNVKYVPDLWCNLFSLVTAMKQGCKLSGKR